MNSELSFTKNNEENKILNTTSNLLGPKILCDNIWKDKLKIKIIDFAYFKDANLRNFTEEERKSNENKNITHAIENLIILLKSIE